MKVYIYTVIFLILLLAAGFSIFAWRDIYLPMEPGSSKSADFLINKGEGAKGISINLEKEGIIKSGLIFRIYVLFSGSSKKLQAGEYQLSPAMNTPQIIEKFISGEVIKQKITIIEGWDLRDVAAYLEASGVAKAEEFLELTKKDFGSVFSFLKDKPKNLDLEGYIFPDTYEISPNDSAEAVLKKIMDNFDKKLNYDLRKEILRQKKMIFEIVTMASLIEKEVKSPEDKKIVSGILWKRIKIGMPLQVDATIAYITGKNTTKISREETKIDSPYNTYKYRGLPLGPICNPGIESIMAAIYPEESDYLYYLSTPAGKTIFSRTLEEHNIAKAEYLK
jgi:UPF0755 protein